MKKLFIILIVAAIVVSALLYVYYSTSYQIIGCTEEAKICPNGRGVGRVGPNCEFAPCELPTSVEECEAKDGFWEDYCYYDYATKVSFDRSLCNNINTRYLRNNCYYILDN